MTKKNFTLDEHKDVGLLLKVSHDCLVTTGVKIHNKCDKKLGTKLTKLADELSKIRSELDDIVAEEGHSTENVYYGERPDLNDIKNLPRN